MTAETGMAETDVAIVGMAGRFPGAPDVDAFWSRVAGGEDCLVDLDEAQLIAAAVPRERLRDPAYVRRAGVLDDVAGFDAGFFGIGDRDAAIMDPQHRHFLECAWMALESAGHTPERFPGAIGVFGGSGVNTYMINNLLTDRRLLDQLGWFMLRHTGNDKDFLTTSVSYRLDLRGPSVNVQTACSTSLVAVHLAVQSLLSFECDMALAGGATIEFPHGQGYQYREGEILSADGRCRAFDAASSGTVLASGAGVVALRRLGDALADGDPILAVIKGSAINNDGARKVSFFAPSVDGHAEVVREALTVAGLSARDVQLLEAHGTGTPVGDPIEVAALTEAFRAFTPDQGFCRLSSTKPNVGHLDTAAGVASLIKVVQALRHETLPPIANHTGPNPLLDLDSSPFVLSGQASAWPADAPRRAGVSSLGVGGTNAHVVIEEAPALAVAAAGAPEQALAISARSEKALADAASQLADHLERHPELDLADVAHTLAVGRRALGHRMVVTARDAAQAVGLLREPDRQRSFRAEAGAGERPPGLAFMFPGGGSQYPGMGAGLDARFARFHDLRREGFEMVRDLGGPNLAALVAADGDRAALRRPTASLPSVFITSVALARQWMAFGAQPTALLGHSLGEYAAAHLAGVMSYEDALSLVVTRSRLMEQAAGKNAAMLVVNLPEDRVRDLLPPALSLAAVNAADECVVAGAADEVERFAARIRELDACGPLLPLDAAAHCALLDPVLPDFLAAVRKVRLAPPGLPYASNVTGEWITSAQATDPQYWVDHLRGCVRFAEGLRTLLSAGPTVFAELGPGQALSSYARRMTPAPLASIPALRHPDQQTDDTAYTLHAFARQWAAGAPVELEALTGGGRRRVRLPTYPFQHKTYWITPVAETVPAPQPASTIDAAPARIEDLDQACWLPGWRPAGAAGVPAQAGGRWVVVADRGDALAEQIHEELARRGAAVEPRAPGASLDEADQDLAGVVVLAAQSPEAPDLASRRWFDDLAQRVVNAAPGAVAAAVTRGAMAADGPAQRAADAMALGVVLAAPREYPGLRSRLVDLEPQGQVDAARIVDDLLADGPTVLAYRNGSRLAPELVRSAAPTGDDAQGFREGGVYAVTGGLGAVGHALAEHLVRTYRAKLVLVASTALPPPADWTRWLAEHAYDDETARRIRRVRSLEALNAEVAVVEADLADSASVRRVLDEAERRFGRIDGAVHAAGVMRDALLATTAQDDVRAVLGAKAFGALSLAEELERRGASLLLLASSTSTALAPPGQAAYVAANAVLDALAGRRGGLRVATMNFGLWSGAGMASDAARRGRLGPGEFEPIAHPVFGERRRRADGEVQLVGRLDAQHHWVVDEHRTEDGLAILPGSGHLALMLAAAELAGRGPVDLVDVVLSAPLAVHDGARLTVRATVASGSIRIESDGGEETGWVLHSEAAFEPIGVAADLEAGEFAHALAQLARQDIAADPLAGPRRRLRLGGRWDAVEAAVVEMGQGFARIALPAEFAPETAAWRAHPALVDVAPALGVALAEGEAQDLYVPVGYDRVRVQAPLPPKLTLKAARLEGSGGKALRVDLAGFDGDGRELLHIRGLELVPLSREQRLGPKAEPRSGRAARRPGEAESLVQSADALGLRPEEGVALIERLLASAHDRIVGSSIDLDRIRRDLDQAHVPAAAPAESADRATPGLAAGPLEGGDVEQALGAMWSELLGLDGVAPDADFFELGGHSLIAVRLMARVRRELGVRLQLADLFDTPTINSLATRIRAERPEPASEPAAEPVGQPAAAEEPRAQARPKSLVQISRAGDKRPFFVVHGGGGNVLFLASLARAMPDRPIFGFQAAGIQAGDTPDASVAAMADRYVPELLAHGPGPYLLGGYSGGGVVALEMANRLQAAGEAVDYVVLLDSVPPGKAHPPLGPRTLNILRSLVTKGPAALAPRFQAQARRLIHTGPSLIKPYLPAKLVAALNSLLPAWARWDEAGGALEPLDRSVIDLGEHFAEVSEGHPMGVYAVDALVVKADQVWVTQPDDYHWGPYIQGQLDFCITSGDHTGLFDRGNVTRLAEVLAPRLDARDRLQAVATVARHSAVVVKLPPAQPGTTSAAATCELDTAQRPDRRSPGRKGPASILSWTRKPSGETDDTSTASKSTIRRIKG